MPEPAVFPLFLPDYTAPPSPPAVAAGGSGGHPLLLLLRRRRRSAVPVTPAPYPDLLAAVVAFLLGEATVTAPLGGPFVYGLDKAPSDAVSPFVVIEGYREPAGGDSAEDASATVNVIVVTSNGDEARAIGRAVKNALDSPNFNPNATGRERFVWATGSEVAAERDRSPNAGPRRVAGFTRGVLYNYEEVIPYVFRVSPESAW